MRKKLLTRYTKILSACLVALGFVGCSNDDDDNSGDFRPILMYGTPSVVYYKVKGTVVSAGYRAPVKNIRAVLVEVHDGEEFSYGTDTVYTHSGGEFSLANSTFPQERTEFKLKLEDVDGEAYGLFEPKDIAVVFEKPNFTGGGDGWYRDETEKDLKTIELEPAEE